MPRVIADSAEAQYLKDIETGLAAEGIVANLQGGFRAGNIADVERPLIMRATWSHPQTGEPVHTKNLRVNHPARFADEQVYGQLVKIGVERLKVEIARTSAPAASEGTT